MVWIFVCGRVLLCGMVLFFCLFVHFLFVFCVGFFCGGVVLGFFCVCCCWVFYVCLVGFSERVDFNLLKVIIFHPVYK